jgi:virginiamycin A acetyltransferase
MIEPRSLVRNAARRLRSLFLKRPLPAQNILCQDRRYSRFEIGEWTYGEPSVVYWDAGATLKIGRYCSIAPEVTILLGGEHHPEWVTTYPFSLVVPNVPPVAGYPHTKGDVVIGSDVWLGYRATVLSGVTVGDGAVIGAKSLVARDVPPFAIMAGNPARLVRFRFEPEQVAALLRIAWWNWPFERVREALPLLQSSRIDQFIRDHDGAPL